MTSEDAVRWGGIAAIISAVLLSIGALGRLLDDPALSLAITIGNIGLVCLVFAFMAIGRVLADEIGTLGLIVVIAATVGAVLLIADGVVLAYVYPVLAEDSLVMLQGSLGLALVSRLGPLALLVASVLLAFITHQAQVLPGRPAWIMLIGALLNVLAGAVASMTFAAILTMLSSLIYATGLAWMGASLRSLKPSASHARGGR